MARNIRLLIGTRKGAWICRGDSSHADWVMEGPIHLGQIVSHLVVDRRTGGTMLMAVATGHLGPTIFRSTDGGGTWVEAKRPPAFEKTADPAIARAVDHTFWLENGHADEPGVWWAGTSPPGLFVSEDDGITWDGVAGFNDNPMYREMGPARRRNAGRTVAQPGRHRPARRSSHVPRHLDRGRLREPRPRRAHGRRSTRASRRISCPIPTPNIGQDAHYIALAPTMPDRLWQQNHCGIYRLDRPAR
jgi:hypothetical protein